MIKISESIVKEPSPHGITLSLVGRKVLINEASSAEAPEMVELEHLPCKEEASGAAKTLSSTYLEIIKETEPRLFSGAGWEDEWQWAQIAQKSFETNYKKKVFPHEDGQAVA